MHVSLAGTDARRTTGVLSSEGSGLARVDPMRAAARKTLLNMMEGRIDRRELCLLFSLIFGGWDRRSIRK